MKQNTTRILSFWCFNPGLGFRKLLRLKPRTIILTSGTLSPMDTFEQELLIKFPIRIENEHVID
jgi:regulator of telomere elongation helicase 1